MTALSDAELAYIRESVDELMPDTATILTVTNVGDNMGWHSETIGTAGTSACRLDPANLVSKSNEVMAGGAIRPFHSFVLTMPYNTSITTENRVRVNDITYNVTSVDTGSWKASVRAFLERT